jgi:hypothetical protein
LLVRTGPTQGKNLSDTSLKCRHLVLITNIRLGFKSLPTINTLSFYKNLYITDKKV